MTGEQKLRKENQALRSEIANLKEKLEAISEELSKKTQQPKQGDSHGGEATLSTSEAKSIEFVAAQYDDLTIFKSSATKELEKIKSRLNVISNACDRIEKSMDAFEAYSYQYNIKIIGMPPTVERENADQTADLCLQLFAALGAKDVTINDIDTAHRVPSRKPSNRPNAIICKFVRRLAKDKVMAARKQARNLQANWLGFPADVDVSTVNLYDHLPPRLQTLLFEAKKYRDANNFKFCWAKNGFVYLRKTETSSIQKISNLDELNVTSSQS